jgi:protein O-GlcNAc transferase
MDSIVQAAIARIESLARGGQLEAAQAACEELLAAAPQEYRAWTLLGMLAMARGQPAAAEAPLKHAVGLFSGDARCWHMLSLAMRMQGKSADAEAAARQTLAQDDGAVYWAGLADCFFDQQRWADAAAAQRQALARNPQDPQWWTSLGSAEQSQGNLAAAAQAYQQALRLAPDDPIAGTRYALLEIELGQVREGVERAARVLGRWPELAPAWLVVGTGERMLGALPQAEAAYRQAVRYAPGDLDAQHNLALVLLQRLRFAEAEVIARALLAAHPSHAAAWLVLSGALSGQGRSAESIAAMRRSLELAPSPITHSKLLVTLQFADDVEPQALLSEHRAWDAVYARPLLAQPPVWPATSTGRPLRIGLSAIDFCSGPTGFLALRAVECLDKQQCSVVSYSDRFQEDDYTRRFQAAGAWRQTTSLTDEELFRQVRQDQIDVLIDLGGHVGRRLMTFARRAAPLQVTWLGYVGTTGLTAMDGLIADRFHVRPGEEPWYVERVLRMPHGYVCYGPPHDAPSIVPLPALKTGRVTFGCFNNPAKFGPRVLAAWAEILRKVPQATLLLKYGGLEEPQLEARLRGELARCGVAADSLRIEGGGDNRQMLAAYGGVDLALDTQPYSGGLTTCEALWMGVPVITFPGRTFAGRHATSHMHNASYPQFVAADWAGYVELAVEWAARLDELAAMRQSMRDRVISSPLCDAPAFAHDFLALLQTALTASVSEGPAK